MRENAGRIELVEPLDDSFLGLGSFQQMGQLVEEDGGVDPSWGFSAKSFLHAETRAVDSFFELVIFLDG